jgi:hypothetical protein
MVNDDPRETAVTSVPSSRLQNQGSGTERSSRPRDTARGRPSWWYASWPQEKKPPGSSTSAGASRGSRLGDSSVRTASCPASESAGIFFNKKKKKKKIKVETDGANFARAF